MIGSDLFTLFVIVVGWFSFLGLAKLLRLERYGLELHPLYVLVKSTRLNSYLERAGRWNPGFWRVAGNVAVVSFFGQVAYISFMLFQNLYRFVFVPVQASPVMPLIPGVTIRFSSMPWFLAAAGVVILLHELGHGVMCVAEGVAVRSAALLLAVLTFGGAVEPDEEGMNAATLMSKLRIFAIGSLVNLVTALVVLALYAVFRGGMPAWMGVFLNWVFFLSVNLAMVNMLPVYPLDGGQMARVYLESQPNWGKMVEKVAAYGFLALMASNLILSLVKFGIVPL
jgi:membrane-associated protease RseP (regulator of RpoE activity)